MAGIGRRRGRGEEGLLEGRLHGHGCSHARPGRALAEATAASSVSAGPAGGQGTRGCRRAHAAPLGATRRAPRGLSVRYLQELEEGDTIARALCTSEPCARSDRIVAGCHATTHRAARQVAPCLFYVKETGPERTVPGPYQGRHWRAWHSDRNKFMYPINAFVLGVSYVPKTILGAGDTKVKDSGAV